jgi:hypothetical protein
MVVALAPDARDDAPAMRQRHDAQMKVCWRVCDSAGDDRFETSDQRRVTAKKTKVFL